MDVEVTCDNMHNIANWIGVNNGVEQWDRCEQ